MRFRLRRQRARLRAAEVNRWNKWTDRLERGQVAELPKTNKVYNPNSRVALCKNVSGNDRAQFETMSISGMTWDLEDDGSTALIFELDTADPDEPPAVLVTPIPDGETGQAVVDGLCLALVGPGSGQTGTPDASNHRIDPDPTGAIKILSAPDGSNRRLLPVVLNGSGSGSSTRIVQTPGGGIAARSGTTISAATCTEYKINSGTTLATNTDTISVKNLWPFAIPGSMYILAARESISNEWIALHPGIIDVDWTSPNLRQTLDGSSYSTIDTAVACT